jgi:hypothetical protein
VFTLAFGDYTLTRTVEGCHRAGAFQGRTFGELQSLVVLEGLGKMRLNLRVPVSRESLEQTIERLRDSIRRNMVHSEVNRKIIAELKAKVAALKKAKEPPSDKKRPK